ncbi:MAG: hypothetical protein IT271_08645 [Chitinophagales bacterium]|nr:hypothetical protein [Chitinophagales bacterium]
MKRASHNSSYPKGGVWCSKDSFVVNQTLVFQIKFCGKSHALRVAAKTLTPQPLPLPHSFQIISKLQDEQNHAKT